MSVSRILPIQPDLDAGEPRGLPEESSSAGASPAPLRDLAEPDLHDLLVSFYDAVEREALLAPYFAPVDMREHMPRIVDFWSTILFQTGRYTGNAFRPHAEMPGLTAGHFARWLAVLEATVDARFAGPAAERMKIMGHRIGYSMQVRLGIPPFEPLTPDPESP